MNPLHATKTKSPPATEAEYRQSRRSWWEQLKNVVVETKSHVGPCTDPHVVAWYILQNAAYREHERFLAGERMTLLVGDYVTTDERLKSWEENEQRNKAELRRLKLKRIAELKEFLNPDGVRQSNRDWVYHYTLERLGKKKAEEDKALGIKQDEEARAELLRLQAEVDHDS